MTNRLFFPVNASATPDVKALAIRAHVLLTEILDVVDPETGNKVHDLEEIVSSMLLETT